MFYSAQSKHTASLDDQTCPPTSLLTEIQHYLARDLMHVNDYMATNIQSSVAIIPQLANHLIAAGGKRIRPIIMLLSAHLFIDRCDINRVSRLAACVEFIHVATLLHDDVIDESELRRGLATANSIWGNKTSVLVGDFLFSRSFQLMVEDGCLNVLKLLSQTAAQISEGEIKQQMSVGNPQITIQEYLDIAAAKTAPLFEAAAQVPALIANASELHCTALRQYGQYLGITFQIIDDILDYTASHLDMGKNLGDDFREGKITLPVILAYQAGNDTEQAFWQRTLADHNQQPADLDQALLYLNDHQIFDKTLEYAVQMAAQARTALTVFPQSYALEKLDNLIDFALKRIC